MKNLLGTWGRTLLGCRTTDNTVLKGVVVPSFSHRRGVEASPPFGRHDGRAARRTPQRTPVRIFTAVAAALVLAVVACSSSTTGTGTGGPGTGTGQGGFASAQSCDATCTRYLACKGVDNSLRAACDQSCVDQRFTQEELDGYESLDCPTLVSTIDHRSDPNGPTNTSSGGGSSGGGSSSGGSSGGGSSGKDCYGCQHDGTSCIYIGPAGGHDTCDRRAANRLLGALRHKLRHGLQAPGFWPRGPQGRREPRARNDEEREGKPSRSRRAARWPRPGARGQEPGAYSFKASAPPMISISSFVIAAWRARL